MCRKHPLKEHKLNLRFLTWHTNEGNPVKKSTFSESKIPVLLKEAEPGRKVNHICHEHGISDAQPLQRGSLINIRRYYIRSKRRLPERLKTPFQVPPMPNYTWLFDLMSDTLQSRHHCRLTDVIEEGSRECLGITIGAILIAALVALNKLVAKHGFPRRIRFANGVEMTSSIFTEW